MAEKFQKKGGCSERKSYNRKDRKLNSPKAETALNQKYSQKFYFVPGRIQQKRLQILKDCARRNGFHVTELIETGLTHLITDFQTREQVLRNLNIPCEIQFDFQNVQIVNTKWFTDSIRRKMLLPITEDYAIKSECPTNIIQPKNEKSIASYNCYACQRRAVLSHCNKKLTEPLELLATFAELRNDPLQSDYPRALAFRKAAAVLKSLPFSVTKTEEISKLKDIGTHCFNVIQEILEDGFSAEVEKIRNSSWFCKMQLFCSVYGIGEATAKKWISYGLSSLNDVISYYLVNETEDKRIRYGLAFHKDLTTPVTKAEAEVIFNIIQKEANDILPGIVLEIAGGFRRGKLEGHDLDILLTHPENGKEIGFLPQLHHRLQMKNLLLFGEVFSSRYTEDWHSREINSTMDLFEKCFCIFKLLKNKKENGTLEKSPPVTSDLRTQCKFANSDRSWRAVRVDLIVSPANQYPFCLVGWTGNKHFNRSLRDYSKKELNMKLTSHGLWDYSTQKSIPASSEKEVFAHLKLPYFEPWERNA